MWACSLQTGSCSVLSLCAHLISTNDSVLTRLGFLGTWNKSVTKTLILQVAKAPHILLILIVALYESCALALVPESQLAKLSCCPGAEPVPRPVSSRAGRHGEPGASISPVWCVWWVMCDMWRVTRDVWCVICDVWWAQTQHRAQTQHPASGLWLGLAYPRLGLQGGVVLMGQAKGKWKNQNEEAFSVPFYFGNVLAVRT